MAQSVSKEEKVIRLLEYLKQYTDEYHPASMPMIKKHFKRANEKNLLGSTNTRRSLIQTVTRVMNSDAKGNLLQKEQWKIVYDNFLDDLNPPSNSKCRRHICNIYYKQEFSDSDVDTILDSIRKNEMISDEDKKNLSEKVIKNLTNNNYHKPKISPTERTRRAREAAENGRRISRCIDRKRAQDDYEW